MANLFIAPVMAKLIDAGFEYLKDQVGWQTGMKKNLQKLRDIHPKIKAVVFAANQAQIREENQALTKWLWQLRDATDEADDVLDEFEYNKHKEKRGSIAKSARKKILNFGKHALKIDPSLTKLVEALQKLYAISAQVADFLPLLEGAKQEQREQQLELYRTRETGSLPKNDLIGRSKEMEFVRQWVRNPSGEDQTTLYRNISLLSVVGHGGMGKTTLLQHLYEDEMAEEFDLRMWVCVSNNFDVKKVIADMLESINKSRPHLETLDILQESLKSEVMSKKFLLVLDDIWEEVEEERDKNKWESVLAPLAYGSLGSKILVTTRMDSVASMISKVIKKKKEALRLEGLEDGECLELLNIHAFADEENSNGHTKLRIIAGEIVKKLSGSPLATKVIGGVLNFSYDERHWLNVLNNDIQSTKLGQNDILPILRLSYIYLPKTLQGCFAFCCIFPQDYEFDRDDLVKMWIALGFIQPPCKSEETPEDVGGRYFDILVKKSFFDKFKTTSKTYYKMHDLLHGLAKSVSAQECFTVVNNNEEVSNSDAIRHLLIYSDNLQSLKKMGKLRNLRTLFLLYTGHDQEFTHLLSEIFKASRSIRLLVIIAPYQKSIPETIHHLIHLRYLKFNIGVGPQLPKTITHLYHLQFIIFNWYIRSNDCSTVTIPRDMNNLFNLRYIELPWDDLPGIYKIGKLHSLQELNGFYVKNEPGYRIEELEHMNELRQLKIIHLENVANEEEAFRAKLCDKRNLTDLSLQWSEIADTNLEENVLDKIQPSQGLNKLTIIAYMGGRSPVWMNKVNLISHLEFIQLKNCFEWQTLPPFGQLPFLKFLYLESMPKVKRIDTSKLCVFPSLELLHIENLEALEDWFDATVAAKDGSFFPSLTELSLINCPNLQELPFFPPKLEKLSMESIGWKAFRWPQGASNCCDMSRLARLRSISIKFCGDLIELEGTEEAKSSENCQLVLRMLVISNPSVLLMEPFRTNISIELLVIQKNDELVSFSLEVEEWFLQARSFLRHLCFSELESLQSLPTSLASLSSLEILRVESAPKLQFLPDIPTSLKRLHLLCLKSLAFLPSSLSFSSLKRLYLAEIPLLKSLPDLPGSLSELHLINLGDLDCPPTFIPIFSSVKELQIDGVPHLKKLVNLPRNKEKIRCFGWYSD